MAIGPDGRPADRARCSPSSSWAAAACAGTLELTADPATKGRYTGKFTLKETGEYRLAYEPGGAEAAGRGPAPGPGRPRGAAPPERQPRRARAPGERHRRPARRAVRPGRDPADPQGGVDAHPGPPRGEPLGQLADPGARDVPLLARRRPAPTGGPVMMNRR